MKKETWSRVLLCGVLCGGLGLSACKKDGEGVNGEEVVVVTETPVVDATADVVPDVVDMPAMVEDMPDAAAELEVDEAMFIKSLYEVTCVQGRIDDTEKQKAIIDEIYARYGFDADSFQAAQASVGQKENVKAALTIRMEKCTSVEVAEGFAKAGDTAQADEETPKEDKVKSAPARRFSTSGSYTARGISMGSFNQGELTITFSSDNRANGQFKIKGDGVLIKIPVTGTVSKEGGFSLNGSKGANNNVRITGNASTKSATGSISGTLNGTSLRSSFSANN